MIVALAGPSRALPRCRRVVDSIRRVGLELAYDWVTQIETDRANGRCDEDLSASERWAAKRGCLDGIRRARVVLWLAGGSEGASYEVGYADALRKPIVVSGANPHPIYGVTVDAWLRTDAAAIEYLVRLARGRRCA